MDSNRDDSEKCLSLGKIYLSQGNIQKALSLFEKSKRLFETPENVHLVNSTKKLIEKEKEPKKKSFENFKKSDYDKNQTKNDNNQTKKTSFQQQKVSHETCSKEDIEVVETIISKKCYYDVLGLEKNCSESEIKKSYRKLALQVHPDKNKAPGAADAFKLVGKAFHILSDKRQRQIYDVQGPSDSLFNSTTESTSRSGSNPFHSGQFQGGFDPFSEFDAFFGSYSDGIFSNIFGAQNVRGGHGFTSFQYSPGYGQRFRAARRGGGGPSFRGSFFGSDGTTGGSNAHNGRNESSSDSTYNFYDIFGLIMFLLIILVLILFTSDNRDYRFNQGSGFNIQRKTTNFGVPYFVGPYFTQSYSKNDIFKLEQRIENDYESVLGSYCEEDIARRKQKLNSYWFPSLSRSRSILENKKIESCELYAEYKDKRRNS